MNKGIGSVLRIMEAGKGSWVWERRERIMNFSKSEKKHVEKSLRLYAFSLILPSFFYPLILPPSLLCLCLESLRSLI